MFLGLGMLLPKIPDYYGHVRRHYATNAPNREHETIDRGSNQGHSLDAGDNRQHSSALRNQATG